MTRGPVPLAALVAALAFVLVPTAAASGPPIEIAPRGHAGVPVTPRVSTAANDRIVVRALKAGGVDGATVAADLRVLSRARSLAHRHRVE